MNNNNSHDASRRRFIVQGAGLAGAAALGPTLMSGQLFASTSRVNHNSSTGKGTSTMSTITTKDGTTIFYKDWGKGQPVVFSHGWPLSADDWDAQMLFFLSNGYRVIALDRRGHGRSKNRRRHEESNADVVAIRDDE